MNPKPNRRSTTRNKDYKELVDVLLFNLKETNYLILRRNIVYMSLTLHMKELSPIDLVVRTWYFSLGANGGHCRSQVFKDDRKLKVSRSSLKKSRILFFI